MALSLGFGEVRRSSRHVHVSVVVTPSEADPKDPFVSDAPKKELRCVQVLRALKTRGLPLGDVGHLHGQGSSSSAPGHTGRRMSASQVKEGRKDCSLSAHMPCFNRVQITSHGLQRQEEGHCFFLLFCDFEGRKINFTNSKLWLVSRPTVTLVTLACVSFHYIFPFFLSLPKKKLENKTLKF